MNFKAITQIPPITASDVTNLWRYRYVYINGTTSNTTNITLIPLHIGLLKSGSQRLD